eukprot:TRINITY_DN10164_c0_g1_i1.p1 TRINITY_DN10164_c0_g1~~TRINITY_DN10164_c0_g1_i1.p1  ORF type:complete len:1324 (+),score=413.26 TRINITY_DN10164_c0_g1_i1:1-3972(+)
MRELPLQLGRETMDAMDTNVKEVPELLTKVLSEYPHDDRIWQIVIDAGVTMRELPLQLQQVITEEDFDLGLQAATAYFKLGKIPGAAAYSLFNAMLLRQIIGFLKKATTSPSMLLVPALQSFEGFLTVQSISGDEELAYEVGSVVAEITGNADRHVAEAAFGVLYSLVSPMHGDENMIIRKVLESLLPFGLLVVSTSGAVNMTTTVPKALQTLQTNTINFVKKLLLTHAEQMSTHALAFAQHLTVKVVDRAEYRTHVAKSIASLLTAATVDVRDNYVAFLFNLARNPKASHRQFAVEVAVCMLQHSELMNVVLTGQDDQMQDVGEELIHNLLLVIVRRCMDKGPAVRARALTSLAALMTSDAQVYLRLPLSKLVFITPSNVEAQQHLSMSPSLSPLVSPFGEPSEGGKQDVLALLRKRACDDKPNVRKAALQVVEAVAMLADTLLLSETDLELLVSSCNDVATGIRKQVIQSLTKILQTFPQHPAVLSAWVRAVLPAVMDVENTVQDKAVEYVLELILAPVCKKTGNDGAWALLACMDAMAMKYLRRACALLGKAKKLPSGLVKSLQAHVVAADVAGAWVILSELSSHVPQHFSSDQLFTCWERVKQTEDIATANRVLEVIANIAKDLEPARGKAVAQEFLDLLKDFGAASDLIHAVINALTELCNAQGGADARRMIETWCSSLLRYAEQILSPLVLGEGGMPADADVETLVRAVFTTGEISLIAPKMVNSNVVTIIQSLVSATVVSSLASQPAAAFATQASQFSMSQSQSLNYSTQSVTNIPVLLRAHALIALGKLCLQDESLAKKSIPVFARELEVADTPIVRNNIMVVLSDLCVRYTSLVDRYVPLLSLSLRDSNEVVRKHTLTLLTKLLSEDYIKWKGLMFHRFVIALADESEDVRTFANYCLMQVLHRKSPLLFFNHIVDLVFYLNDCNTHPGYNKMGQTEREVALFTMPGADNESKRLTIYQVLVAALTDEQKFNLAGKLCMEVLGSVTDGHVDATVSSGVLSDALQILISKDIKLNLLKSKTVDDIEDADSATQVLQVVRGKLLSKMMKTNIIENIVPIVVELKQSLEKQHSSHLRLLMYYLRDLIKEYKEEVNDILAADPQLAKEVEFDLRRFEQEQKQKKLTRRQSTASNILPSTPLRRTVSAPDQMPTTATKTPPTPRTPFTPDRAGAAGARATPGPTFSVPQLRHQRRGVSTPVSTAKLAALSINSQEPIALPSPSKDADDERDTAGPAEPLLQESILRVTRVRSGPARVQTVARAAAESQESDKMLDDDEEESEEAENRNKRTQDVASPTGRKKSLRSSHRRVFRQPELKA